MSQVEAQPKALDAPRFDAAELHALKAALEAAAVYIGPIGITEHATKTRKEARNWIQRVSSLIAETEEWDQWDGHWSDCATHNESAGLLGPCDCRVPRAQSKGGNTT